MIGEELLWQDITVNDDLARKSGLVMYEKLAEKDEKKIIAEQEEKKAKEQKRADERKARAQEIDELQKAYVGARKAYTEALEKFCKDYGTFHTSVSADNLFDFFLSWM